jgi:hypothetical protein
VALHDNKADLVEGASCRIDLIYDIDAIFASVNHLLNAPDLSLNFFEAANYYVFCFFVYHGIQYTPMGYPSQPFSTLGGGTRLSFKKLRVIKQL